MSEPTKRYKCPTCAKPVGYPHCYCDDKCLRVAFPDPVEELGKRDAEIASLRSTSERYRKALEEIEQFLDRDENPIGPLAFHCLRLARAALADPQPPKGA